MRRDARKSAGTGANVGELSQTRHVVEGLGELESRLLRRLPAGEAVRILLRWEVDGRLFLRLRVRRHATGIAYVWLEENSKGERRDIRGAAELERLLMRQLREPAGEEIVVYWENAETPILRFWAMIADGERLRCAWTDREP